MFCGLCEGVPLEAGHPLTVLQCVVIVFQRHPLTLTSRTTLRTDQQLLYGTYYANFIQSLSLTTIKNPSKKIRKNTVASVLCLRDNSSNRSQDKGYFEFTGVLALSLQAHPRVVSPTTVHHTFFHSLQLPIHTTSCHSDVSIPVVVKSTIDIKTPKYITVTTVFIFQ